MRRDMKNRDIKKLIHRLLGGLCAGVVCCILGACSDRADESGFSVPDGQMNRISLQPGIMPIDIDSGYPSLASELQTQIRDSRFKVGDSVGLFSRGGNIVDGESTNFVNLPLVFDGRTFNSDELSNSDPGRMEKFFSYYPYREGMETEVDIYAKKEGTDEHEEPLRVMDFLTTNYSGNGEQMSQYGGANFYHTFAIVRVKLGKGFDDFDGDIYLQLERKVKGVRIDMSLTDPNENDQMIVMASGITGAVLKLVYDDTAVTDESRRLKTFPNEATGDNKRWDVIVPCRPMMWWHAGAADAAEIGGVTVQAIILDPKDDGKEIKIPVDNYEAFVGQMGGDVQGIRGSFIYTVCIEKRGFEASVFPVDVQKWNEGTITENIPVGIANEAEYKEFILKYNELFKVGDSYSNDVIAKNLEVLKRWGTAMPVSGTDSIFTVFLTNDIDLSKDTEMDNLIIDNLVIPIDGRGKTIRNCQLNGSFCKTIGSTGSLKNLRFEDLKVASGGTEPIGLLAGTMEGGTIEGCRVTRGRLEEGGTPERKVGAAVGTMKDGTVKNCWFDGFMFGTSDETQDDLVGDYQGGSVTDNSNRNNMRVVKN